MKMCEQVRFFGPVQYTAGGGAFFVFVTNVTSVLPLFRERLALLPTVPTSGRAFPAGDMSFQVLRIWNVPNRDSVIF